MLRTALFANPSTSEKRRVPRAAETTRVFEAFSALASLLCGIHCIALPTFTAAMLLMGVSLRQQVALELTLMLGSMGLAIIAFFPSALAGRNAFSLQATILALGFYLLSWQLSNASELMRQSLAVSASLLLVVAHGHNLWRMHIAKPQPACAFSFCERHS